MMSRKKIGLSLVVLVESMCSVVSVFIVNCSLFDVIVGWFMLC